jgi:hypothetical protein
MWNGRFWPEAEGPHRSRGCAKPDTNHAVVGADVKSIEFLVPRTI